MTDLLDTLERSFAMAKENKRMKEALRRAADTFRELNFVLRIANKPISAEACQVAENDARKVLEGK